MFVSPLPRLRRGQWSLVGVLVALAIILILAGLYIPRIAARHSHPGEAATPRERAYGAACEQYLSQMNQAVSLYKTDNEDRPPSRLEELKHYGVTDDMLHAEGCSFQIDPATGAVTENGKGRAAPAGRPSTAPPPAVPSGPRGPGGVRLPTIPGAGGVGRLPNDGG